MPRVQDGENPPLGLGRGAMMHFYEQFGVSPRELGGLRDDFVRRVEKEVGDDLEYRAALIPLVADSERSRGVSRFFLGPSLPEQVKQRLLLFSAQVKNQNFTNMIGFLGPIPLQHGVFFEEYTYTTLLPTPTDAPIAFIERRGWFTGKRGFYPLVRRFPQTEISQELLFQNVGNQCPAFDVAVALQQLRMSHITRHEVDERRRSNWGNFVCDHLNSQPQLYSLVKDLVALPEARRGRVRVKDDVGLTTILVPMKSNTLIQVGDFSLKPRRAFAVLNALAFELHSSHLKWRQTARTGTDVAAPTGEAQGAPYASAHLAACPNCGTRIVQGGKFCPRCGTPVDEVGTFDH